MQSDNGATSPSGESQRDSPPSAPQMADVFTITQEDATIMHEYLGEYDDGNTDLRHTIVANVMAILCDLRPETSPFNKIEASRVPLHIIPLSNKANIFFRKSESGFKITLLSLSANMSNLCAGGPLGPHSTICVGTKS